MYLCTKCSGHKYATNAMVTDGGVAGEESVRCAIERNDSNESNKFAQMRTGQTGGADEMTWYVLSECGTRSLQTA